MTSAHLSHDIRNLTAGRASRRRSRPVSMRRSFQDATQLREDLWMKLEDKLAEKTTPSCETEGQHGLSQKGWFSLLAKGLGFRK